jgi:hypothetical protein
MLAEMIETCAYVVGTNHVHVYNLLNHSRKSPSDFHDTHVEKKRWALDENGKARVKQISKIWVEHPGRVTVDDYDLNPRLPFGIQGNMVNLWKGYPHYKVGLTSAAQKNEAIKAEWQKFMEGLFGEHRLSSPNGDMPIWQWVALWTGHLLNCPWERTTQAIMLVTMVQGIGKSLYGDVVRDLCGEHGLEGKSASMFVNFNADMEAKTFVMVNELDIKFNSKEGQLNDLLTEEKVRIEQKGKDVIELPNLRRWYFTTNTSSPCRLSKGQRRVLVINPPRVMADTRGEWGIWVREVVAGYRKDEEALAAIREWFNDVWFGSGMGEGVWRSDAPVPITEAALDAAEASMTVNQIIAQDLYEAIVAMEGGWCSVHPDLRKRNVKAWGDVTGLVKAHGGYVGQKTIKDDGVVKTYTIFDSCGRLERVAKPSSGNTVMKVDADEARTRALAIAKTYLNITELLTGTG